MIERNHGRRELFKGDTIGLGRLNGKSARFVVGELSVGWPLERGARARRHQRCREEAKGGSSCAGQREPSCRLTVELSGARADA